MSWGMLFLIAITKYTTCGLVYQLLFVCMKHDYPRHITWVFLQLKRTMVERWHCNYCTYSDMPAVLIRRNVA